MKRKTQSEVLAMTPEQRERHKMRLRMVGLSPTEVIRLWYRDPEAFDLDDRESAILTRLEYAKAQFMACKRYGECLQALQEEFGIGVSQARNDVRNMRHLFGDLDAVPKEAHRQRAIQMALDAFNTANKEKDPAAMAAATKVYIQAAGLDKEDVAVADLEKAMKERNYVEVLDPQVRTLLLNFLQGGGGVIDMSAAFNNVHAAAADMPGFTDFEEVPAEGATAPE